MSQTPSPSLDRRTTSKSAPAVATDRRESDRRTRSRFRELCDEVLASHRVARGADPLSPEDRAAAAELLPRVAPIAR